MMTADAQSIFDNNSFEGEPQDATVPHGWFPCEEGTTPDILPGPWGVYLEPYEGDTYVGLITRDNGTWESIGQRLKDKLEKDQCYKFSLSLAHSASYSGYNGVIKLRIWGGKDKCDKMQVIAESEFIDHLDWKKYHFQFKPEKPIQYIIVEAFYSEKRFSFRGNILLDFITPIVFCNRT